MIHWQFFPKNIDTTTTLKEIVKVFEKNETEISSESHQLQISNVVLSALREDLGILGFDVEKGKKSDQVIKIPVLFGLNGKIEKSFHADAYHEEEKIIIEIEAGRAVSNNQFLKDLFQACMMYNIDYLVLAVRNIYRGKNDFDKVITFFETLYASNRINLPLKGVLIIGY